MSLDWKRLIVQHDSAVIVSIKENRLRMMQEMMSPNIAGRRIMCFTNFITARAYSDWLNNGEPGAKCERFDLTGILHTHYSGASPASGNNDVKMISSPLVSCF